MYVSSILQKGFCEVCLTAPPSNPIKEDVMLELFVVGSFWFWALIVAELVLLFLFTEFENGICATISLVVFGAALQFMGNVNLVGYVVSHPVHLALAVAAYLLLGTAWGVFKWRKLVVDRLRQHDELFAQFLHDKGLPSTTTVLPMEYRKDWKYYVDRTKEYKTGQTVADTPLARQHKARIVRWMSLWPFSVTLYLFKDMVAEVFNTIYVRLGAFLQRIADNLYAGRNVKANLELPPEEPRDGTRR